LLGIVGSAKRFIIILAFLIGLAFSTILLFDLFIAAPINLPTFLIQAMRIALIIGFWLTILLFVRRSKSVMTSHIGAQAATILQFFIGTIAVLVMVFAVLHTLGVSPESLLTGAGIASITIGLIISTFVGSILAGALVFMTHQFRVGDTVLVNNIPGKVTEITLLATRIRNDMGQISIPNSAIASGNVIVTKIHKYETTASQSRLPYALGDRVITTYTKGEGVVKELTPLHTIILLDSGKELTFLNSNILSGSVAVAKITQQKPKT
jgi:small-conductance mechanosensitive channel